MSIAGSLPVRFILRRAARWRARIRSRRVWTPRIATAKARSVWESRAPGLPLAPLRRNGMDGLPIGDYALLSDCRSAALVSRDGSVDWLCFPRFDGPSVFCRLLDPNGGHFSIRPTGDYRTRRRYAEDTMVLETTYDAAGGTAVLTDAMAIGPGERGHDLGAGSPGVLLRRLVCVEGSVDAEIVFAPRPEYGLVEPALEAVEGGLLARFGSSAGPYPGGSFPAGAASGGGSSLRLSSQAAFDIAGPVARAGIRLAVGQAAAFAVGYDASVPWSDTEITERLSDAALGWRSWSAIHQTYEGPWRDLVRHSGRVLQALTFQPTGAIVAAPTTSLPEVPGGTRNWDYRYTWVRDASLTMEALWVAACPDEANKFFAFLATASQLEPGADLQIMYGVGGERDLTERELPHLAGWRGSQPVRVGNAAWRQRQLDVYGELLGAAQRLVQQLGVLEPVTRRFLVASADAAAARWRDQDQGIWEVRGTPRDFLHSKLMCWVALVRAIELATVLGAEDRVPAWTSAREDVRAAILQSGWNDAVGAFTQSFGSHDIDASSLMLVITGFLPAWDPRIRATIDAVARTLTDDRGLVYRYRSQDGLPGEEGALLLCTFWLAQAQALAGEVDAAVGTFERAIASINDVGLIAEEVDRPSGEMTGNFPQAFSHIGLVNAAWAIAEAMKRTGSAPGSPIHSRAPRRPRS